MKSLKRQMLGITLLSLITLLGCSSLAGEKAAQPSSETTKAEINEARERALDEEGWITIATGFRYRNHHGGVAFWITPAELSQEGLRQVATYVRELERSATSDIERFRLGEWQTQLAKARIDYSNWQRYWPKLRVQVQEGVAEGIIPQGTTLQLALASCSLGASAMPTTSSPGAKGYATAYCNPGAAISGYVRTETSARTGNDWPAPCRDNGWSSSQCNSVAYGSSGCNSTALAEYYYEYQDTDFVADSRYDSNSSCT